MGRAFRPAPAWVGLSIESVLLGLLSLYGRFLDAADVAGATLPEVAVGGRLVDLASVLLDVLVLQHCCCVTADKLQVVAAAGGREVEAIVSLQPPVLLFRCCFVAAAGVLVVVVVVLEGGVHVIVVADMQLPVFSMRDRFEPAAAAAVLVAVIVAASGVRMCVVCVMLLPASSMCSAFDRLTGSLLIMEGGGTVMMFAGMRVLVS